MDAERFLGALKGSGGDTGCLRVQQHGVDWMEDRQELEQRRLLLESTGLMRRPLYRH